MILDAIAEVKQTMNELPHPNRVDKAPVAGTPQEMGKELDAMAQIVKQLKADGQPYVFAHWLRHTETCLECGVDVNVGHFAIVNPPLGKTYDLPYIAGHYMQEHGMTNYKGSETEGTVDMGALRCAIGLDVDSD